MKRESMAVLLLIALAATSLWNIRRAKALTDSISGQLSLAETAAAAGDMPLAEAELQKALDIWLDAESYTHIFIRHPETDSCTEQFYDTLILIAEGDSEALKPGFELLRRRLESISAMERIRPGNIF